MSLKATHNVIGNVTDILRAFARSRTRHHFGIPFLTAYQIAIKFADQHPAEAAAINRRIGGAGQGSHNSLAQYLARQLSGEIRACRASGTPCPIEGAFVSGVHVQDFLFDGPAGPIHSSVNGGPLGLSMFRIVR